jgi:hypothetical protein
LHFTLDFCFFHKLRNTKGGGSVILPITQKITLN